VTNSRRTSWARRARSPKTLLAGATLLVGVPAVAFTGGALSLSAGYVGPLPSTWFDPVTDPCNVEPITRVTSTFSDEFQIDVSAVANDGDPNTFARCTLKANLQTNTCLAGLSDGTVVGCRDTSGPHTLPSPGDILYLDVDPVDPAFCNVSIGTGDRFGVADPKCRASGGGGSGGSTGGGGTLGCTAANSTAVVASAGTNFQENTCYSFHKVSGTLRYGNWSGNTFTVNIQDSASNSYASLINSGNWFNVVGVANGTIYFKVDVTGSATNVTAQVDGW
jgi:hypothetical protein